MDGLNVRTEPSLKGQVVASYGRGEKVVLDGWGTYADGFLWGRYVGTSSGQLRYVAIGTDSGSEWYLTMCR